MNDLELLKKERPLLIEGSLFSTTKNNKTLKIAYKQLENRPEEGRDFFGFSLPFPNTPVEAILVRDRMVYKNSLVKVIVNDAGEVFWTPDEINDAYNLDYDNPIISYEDVIFLDAMNMSLFKNFYGLD